jgi:murein DD-endopeptidase MepM/ murein hydrolase activator NlpD
VRAVAPLPIRADWTPSYLKARGDFNLDYAYRLRDAQGAPANDGQRYHSAVDWFAPGAYPVRSPVAGRVYQVDNSRGTTGQVFGGVVRILEPSGVLWVMRHVDPLVAVGTPLQPGLIVATVTPWRDGSPHLHMEIWRTPTGGYRHENMIDPREVEWVTVSTLEREPTEPPHGNTLRLALNGETFAGWDEVGNRLKWIAKSGLKPDTTAAIAWRQNTWRGPKDVTNVAKHLVAKYLTSKETA